MRNTFKKRDTYKKIVSQTFAGFYGLLTLLLAISLSWVLLANTNYFYGFWYEHGGIAGAIEEFAPQNRKRTGFEDTDKKQRIEIFAKIVKAVHNDGVGLESIFYLTPENAPGVPLLHEAEIIHLKDVARLISILQNALVVTSTIWLALSVYLVTMRSTFPKIQAQLCGFALVAALVLLIILAFGWEATFNQMHIWIFPAEHQWFFYYQDSLMSTMMWAPHLFSYIGLAWALLASIIFIILLLAQRYINLRFSKRPEH